jgi:alpha-L-fucosidase
MTQHRFEPTWDSLKGYTVPEWYVDAKFGIFIHWGLYAVPAFGNEWYARNMYRQGTPEFEHHRSTYGDHTQFGYKDFIPLFTADKFDADEWAQLFKEAGARYVMPVAEHHDGFALYDSAYSDWTSVKMGPKRDLIGELAAAVRNQGLVFGLSSHRAEHWWFFDGGRAFPSDVQDERYAGLYAPAAKASPDHTGRDWDSLDWQPRPDGKFLEDWLARCCELVDKYQPQVVWFDWWIQQIIFERGQLKGIRPHFWQTDTSVSKNSWGYIADHDYKAVGDIIGDLVDIVSKNGALLLNIGPRPDGTIPEAEQAMLREIGRWLAVNGEAIYETRPWETFGEGPTEVSEGSFTDTHRAGFTGQDIRFTRKDDALYAICLGWPEGEVVIRSLGSSAGQIAGVQMLGADAKIDWSQDEGGLRASVPAAKPCEHAYVYKIILNL